MAALPSPTQVAGGHSAIYEAYYNQVDPTHQGSISAPVAAKFLKKSGLSDIILSKIWDLSDPNGKGCLNRGGFFMALKLVALAQSGKAVNMVNINCETPPPKMGELPNVLPTGGAPAKPPQPNAMPSTEWTVQPTERAKYDKLFDSLEPANGLLQGNKVRGVMMNSKLPMPTLGKIWDLADMDKDGMLDRHEFTVAMHLVYKALEKYTIPASLPPELMRPKPPVPVAPVIAMQAVHPQPHVSNKPPAIPPMPQIAPIIPQLPLAPSPIPAAVAPPAPQFTSPNTVHWVVSPEERNRFEARFRLADKDKDGFVSGGEIKDIFLQSGVPPPVLAHIWGLCDTHQTGKLNVEQFALSMWFIEQTLKGVKPPATLAPDMVPPCMRPKVADGAAAGGQAEQPTSSPYPNNPELDMISREIDELAREKRVLETDIAQKEADIKIKSGEIKSLQSELDTLAATLKQLENQRGEAQKRLNDLKSTKSSLDKEVSEIKLLLEEEQTKVAQLRSQADEQERGLKVQEEELSARRQELEGLKQEETRLETLLQQSRSGYDGLTTTLQDTQLLISQAKAKITQLEEQQRQMSDNLSLFDSALTSGDASSLSDSSLAPASTEFRDPEFVRFAMVNGGSPPAEKNAAFASQDPFTGTNGSMDSGGFGNDAFSNDKFKSSQVNSTGDAFGDPFAASFPANQQSSGFSSDPFAAAFGGSASSGAFDPFGENQGGTSKTPVDMSDKDPFGCDPFAAASPAPSPSPGPPLPPLPGSAGRGTDSPTPALPPKKSKQPPPRPAPPKSMLRAAPQPPLPASPSPEPNCNSSGADPFGGASDPFTNNASDPFSSGGFANFADFDNKSQEIEENSSFANVVNNNVSSGGSQPPRLTHHNNNNNNTPPVTPPAPARTTSKGRYAGMEFTEDPFRDYRYEDPFEIEDPFENEPLPEIPNPKLSKSPVVPRPPSGTDEEKQVAWAAAESVRVEEERKQRLQKQEQADLEYALALSRSEATAGGK